MRFLQNLLQSGGSSASDGAGNIGWRITFAAFPTSLQELQTLPEAALQEPYQAAALLIPALCLWNTNKDEAVRMINFLKGAQPLSTYEKQFITERLRGNEYVPQSYFEGATPENDYQPGTPYSVIVSTVPTSFSESGYAQLYLYSGGADSPRPVKLRQKPSTGQWFLTDQMLLAQIRKPNSQDPWK
jgi:hypothetical protein